jgi:hypothetical protein
VLGTIATNHTHGLEAAHHSLVSSLIGGYHLAFTIGAVAVAAGIVAAISLLRTPATPEPDVVIEPDARSARQFAPEFEQQAA